MEQGGVVDYLDSCTRINLMKEVIGDVDQWLADGQSGIVLATVIDTWGSAPRKNGAKMAYTAGGATISGSVSGGCVEGAVIAAGDEVLMTGRPQLLHFGVADESAWEVGLACGGTIDVFVECLDVAAYQRAREWVERREVGAIVTVVRGPEALLGGKMIIDAAGRPSGSIAPELDETIIPLAEAARKPARHQLSNDIEIFIDVIRPSPTLIIIGGAHIAIPLVQIARIVGYRTMIIDPRRAFGSEARFPEVDELISAFPDKALTEIAPDSETAVVTLSHDPKIDDPALHVALHSKAFYVGALGSRRTTAKRHERLLALGFTEEELARLHAPIGLDIGADSPEEIALAIMGQIVAAYRGPKYG